MKNKCLIYGIPKKKGKKFGSFIGNLLLRQYTHLVNALDDLMFGYGHCRVLTLYFRNKLL